MSRERELLAEIKEYLGWSSCGLLTPTRLVEKIEALLAEPEAEPFICGSCGVGPLYTHPTRQPVPLSDEEISVAQINHARAIGPDYEPICLTDEEKKFWIENGRAVIAAYEEKQK